MMTAMSATSALAQCLTRLPLINVRMSCCLPPADPVLPPDRLPDPLPPPLLPPPQPLYLWCCCCLRPSKCAASCLIFVSPQISLCSCCGSSASTCLIHFAARLLCNCRLRILLQLRNTLAVSGARVCSSRSTSRYGSSAAAVIVPCP